MPVLRLHECPARPWKNGLGRTRELAVEPPQAGLDDFLWRASIAEVDSGAPFSRFPGIDRTIVLLDGAGFHMDLGEGHGHALTEPFAPFAFPGEAPVTVTLAGGPTRDFNLMVRRGKARGRIEVWRHPAGPRWHADTVLLLCARGQLQVDDTVLQAGDAWRPPAGAPPPRVAPGTDAVALAVVVERGD